MGGGAAGAARSANSGSKSAVPLDGCASFGPDDAFALLYTSGTTEHPKGVRWTPPFLASLEQYLRYAIGLRDDDVFWNMPIRAGPTAWASR